ncbi:MAG TPA: hypothetical protein VM802_17895 [Chitinophaga sp.]|uniref:hypothetical protein n=1 Tax=Chitinophaga sp. TaxID=1869181 RepID=UPI002C3B4308|nr:hypothetical protein [Chitinophaga sp.]HVI46756.1 hypothetical protein [Chitinophaga sp.]
MPTLYRKMRGIDTTNDNGKLIPALSNAEKDKILEVAEEIKEYLIRQLAPVEGQHDY